MPERKIVELDFFQISQFGGNAIRIYYPPPIWLMDLAAEHGLKVFVDVPWEKHRCFFEDWKSQVAARENVRKTAARIGEHTSLFAISVVNEIPVDIVRFYGKARVEDFIDSLVDSVKQESPTTLTTFVNFPTTEFLTPRLCDFCCFNVYLHDVSNLAVYLDRLQHVAGDKPLILGEYGVDSIRNGQEAQAQQIAEHVNTVLGRGLAGSFVFSFTDDWYTGGHQIDDWAFGVVDRERAPKPAAKALENVWASPIPKNDCDLPKVSVVVCSYNGSATIRECLLSLHELNYPDFEIIVVDDGSTDGTSGIVDEFPQVTLIRQENKGLSAARNAGAQAADGDIVAYTDDDCVADEGWLFYLVQAMRDQEVQAIGGPNITPPDDTWTAKCVAASPGNPCHVMLDDQYAEHVPGCNMAFRKEVLLGLGGFDSQFRQAGDDVDVCWRLLDAGYQIGYSPGAMVWHHRRATVRAFFKQQKGYGRGEAMLYLKHPRRYGSCGMANWNGVIYGDGAVGLPIVPERIYHGQFGMAPFQTIYRQNYYGYWAWFTSLPWHLAAIGFLVLAILFWPLMFVSLGMWSATMVIAVRSAAKAPLPRESGLLSRLLVAFLHLAQPVVRGWHRGVYLLRRPPMPKLRTSAFVSPPKVISRSERDVYWQSDENLGREQLLTNLVQLAERLGFPGDFDNANSDYDIKVYGDRWHDVTIRTATEELGWPKRFTRARCAVQATSFKKAIIGGTAIWTLAALASLQPWAIVLGLAGCATSFAISASSRRRCLRTATALANQAGLLAELQPFGEQPQIMPHAALPEVNRAVAPNRVTTFAASRVLESPELAEDVKSFNLNDSKC